MSNENKTAFYLRSATGNLADLKKQQRRLEIEAEKFGLSVSQIQIYCDSHQSGMHVGPELSRLENDIVNGKIRLVFVSRINRISRSTKHLKKFFDLTTEYKFRFISPHENVDSLYWSSNRGEQ